MNHLARIILLPICLVLAGVVHAKAASGWLTTVWEVFCTTAAENELSTAECDDLQFAAADDGPHVTPASRVREDLEAMSAWLKGLGFSGPKVPSATDSGTTYYQAWLGTDTDHATGTAWYDGSNLFVKPGYFFAMGENEAAAAEGVFRIGAPAHELFHAIQMTNAATITLAPKYAWITEGMAQSVLYEWLHKAGIAGADFKYPSREHRHYDIPLHKPHCGVISGERQLGCYATHYFWTWVGQHLGSRDNVQYLRVLLKQDLSAAYGLAGIDAGLRDFDEQGLYNLFPEFIAQFANSDQHFEHIEQQQLDYAPEQETTVTVQAQVEPMAAGAWRVEVPIPANEAASLKIELAGEQNNLHLVVDDQRLDRGSSERNVFRTALQAGHHSFFVRVANVASHAEDTKAQDFQLKFSLGPRPTCTFQARLDYPEGPITVEGSAGLYADILSLYSDDWNLAVDISELELGAGPGHFTTTGKGFTAYRVELDLETNSDPGNAHGWHNGELTMQEILASDLGFPERRAMLRLVGQFKAQQIDTDGPTLKVEGQFDAGDQVYLCERVVDRARKVFREIEEKGPQYWDELDEVDVTDPKVLQQHMRDFFEQWKE